MEGRGRGGGRRGRRGDGLEVEEARGSGFEGGGGEGSGEGAGILGRVKRVLRLGDRGRRGGGRGGLGEKQRVGVWGLGKEREWRRKLSRGVQTRCSEARPSPTLPPETQSRRPGLGASRGSPRALNRGTPVRSEPPRRSAQKTTSRAPDHCHSPSMVPARLRLRLRRCAPGSALAACSALCGGRRGLRAPTSGQHSMPQRPLLAPPHAGLGPPRAGRPRAPPLRRRCGAAPAGRSARKGLRRGC